jgi:Heparan-alpha-glucosaminide N-acetyltransferase, catalytic
VDAARAVALAGMASVHILPVQAPDGTETVAGAIAAGRASALFAVLAGVGVALATGGASARGSPRRAASTPRTGSGSVPVSSLPAGSPRTFGEPPGTHRAHAAAAAGLLVRGLLVALVGLALVELNPPVAVILAYYGLLFAVATPLLRLRAPALAALAAVWCVAGPVASQMLRAGRQALPGPQPGFAALAAPGDLLRELTLTGYYPVLPWLTYLLAGMAVGRTDLRSARVAAGLLGGGTVLAVLTAGGSALLLGPGGGAAVLGPDLAEWRYGTVPTDTWWWLAVAAPHTGTPFDLAHTTGTALAVLGAALLLARAVPALVWPLAGVGAMPLTLYTLHVTALALYPPEAAEADGVSVGTLLAVHLAAALVVGVAVRAAGRRGPLEAAVGAVSGGVRRAVARVGVTARGDGGGDGGADAHDAGPGSAASEAACRPLSPGARRE